MRWIRKQFRKEILRRGYIHEPRLHDDFHEKAFAIQDRHQQQTSDDVQSLSTKHEKPVLGDVHVYELLERLAFVYDPSDPALGTTSQLIHTLQVVEAMEDDGVTDPDMIVTALIHDLGKLLFTAGEAPENVFCMIEPIGDYVDGVGLDACIFQWNHDEFIYSRFKDHVSDDMAWVLRYHSIYPDQCARLMTPEEREKTERLLKPFQHYDQDFKSTYYAPDRRLEDYRALIEERFPDPISF